MALPNSLFHQSYQIAFVHAFVFFGQDGLTVMDADFAGMGEFLAFWPTFIRPIDGHRQNRRFRSGGQTRKTRPKRFYFAVGRSGAFGKNQHHFAPLQPP